MPIYEYECTKCGKIGEVIQCFSSRPLVKCSHCSGKLHKLVSQSSFHLKGSGWYATDYANKPQKTPSSPTKKETATTAVDNSEKTTSKTAEPKKADSQS
ncbi:MAG: zinc ribbon domain-containing protein [Desulfobacterales bacterium]|nr:zinc ribbon domain-containing protein [Desulfobacterales bacterium]